MTVSWCGRTDICGRPVNEDAFAMQQVTPRLAAFAVADGLGGLPAGEVASRVAVESLMETVRSLAMGDSALSTAGMEKMLGAGFLAAAESISATTAARPGTTGMATTLVAALISDSGSGVVAFAGDSRAYHAGDALVQITTDHSLVQELVLRGVITPDGARVHPDRNVVTRVISGIPVDPDFAEFRLGGGTLLLCTDGLTDAMNDEEIFRILQDPDLDRICTRLIERPVQIRHDNTTVIVVRASDNGQSALPGR